MTSDHWSRKINCASYWIYARYIFLNLCCCIAKFALLLLSTQYWIFSFPLTRKFIFYLRAERIKSPRVNHASLKFGSYMTYNFSHFMYKHRCGHLLDLILVHVHALRKIYLLTRFCLALTALLVYSLSNLTIKPGDVSSVPASGSTFMC